MMTLFEPGSEVDERMFRTVAGHLASGVTVITTQVDGVDHGMTASSVTTLSASPALMVACLNNGVPTSKAVAASGRYAVNVLAESQGHVAAQFAAPTADKFAGVAIERGVLGDPLLIDALATLECEVTEAIVGGTHSMVVGRVVRAVANQGRPLTYFKGGFGRFELAADDGVYRRARELILRREYGPDGVVSVPDLARRLDVAEAAAFYALTRLSSDSLVRAAGPLKYSVVPFDAELAREVFEARLAIEIGAITRATNPTDAEIDSLRTQVAEMEALIDGDTFVDFDRYLDVNHAFHKGVVGLAHNPSLVAVFEALSSRSVMSQSFGATTSTRMQYVTVQERIVDAIETRDIDGAKQAAAEYCGLAIARAHQILELHGGVL